MKKIFLRPIGIIRTPYLDHSGMPIQGKFEPDVKAKAVLYKKYMGGLKDLDGFSHAIFLYHLNKAHEERIQTKPFMEDIIHGVFSTRSPLRPNHIGMSVVKIISIKENTVHFSEVDMLDGTPLLDIKPYMPEIDAREDVKIGWAKKHLNGGKFPDRAIHK